MRPGTLSCSPCTWTNVSLNNKYEETVEGKKNNFLHEQLGQILDKRNQRTNNSTAASEEHGSERRGLSTPPAHNSTEGQASHLSLHDPWTPLPHPTDGTRSLPRGSEERADLLLPPPPDAAGPPVKCCLNLCLDSSQFLLTGRPRSLSVSGQQPK